MNLMIKVAGTAAAVAAAIGVVGVVAYDSGRSDGKADGAAVFVEPASLDVLGPQGAVALRRDDVTGRGRFDLFVGPRDGLRLVGSYDGTTGRLTIVRK